MIYILVFLTIYIIGLHVRYQKYDKVIDAEQKLKEVFNEVDILNNGIKDAVIRHTSLKAEIESYEDQLSIMSHGIYEPRFLFDDPEDYKNKIKELKTIQKGAIKDKKAVVCSEGWSVDGCEKKGKKLTDGYSNLMLRAFNMECDSLMANVSHSNIASFKSRLNKSVGIVNKLGDAYKISISGDYVSLKMSELVATFEYKVAKQKEKDKQREIKEQMRVEAAELKALEAEKKKAESAEAEAEKDVLHALKMLEKDKENVELQQKLKELEERLENGHERVRKVSQAMLTKTGFVYVISNPSFNVKDRFKIGMTRRLAPLDRVKELSGASVPFKFDVNAMIYTENAPELESKLHKIFYEQRVNKANSRKEFFDVSLTEIEKAVSSLGIECSFNRVCVNNDYMESCNERSYI